MTSASAIGSMPGQVSRDFDEAVRVVLGELPDLPAVPEVPGRGVHAGMVGRTLATIEELGFDLQPAGWRLTHGAPALDHRRARSLLGQDLDTWEASTQDFAGSMKQQLAGPWTLVGTVERPQGDRLLADYGARRELVEAYCLSIATHVRSLKRRVPGAQWLIQVDEPLLPAVLGGAVPTASGFHRHRSVGLAEAMEALAAVAAAVQEAGAHAVLHSCAPGVPWDEVRRAGFAGLFVDLDVVDASALDVVAAAIEAQEWVGIGVLSTGMTQEVPTAKQITARASRLLDSLGVAPHRRLVLTPGCGLAGSTPDNATRSLAGLAQAARALT